MTEYERLEAVANFHFKNLSNLAIVMQKDRRIFYTYKKRGTIGRLLMKELEEIGINPQYIRTGEGSMLLNDTTSADVDESTLVKVPIINEKSIDELIRYRDNLAKEIDNKQKEMNKINKIIEILDETE